MPQVYADHAGAWLENIIQHIITTGHMRLQPADDPRHESRSFGIACTVPDCTQVYSIGLERFGPNHTPQDQQLLSEYGSSQAGKDSIIFALIATAQRRAPRLLAPLLNLTQIGAGELVFSVGGENEHPSIEVLRFTSNGDIYVKGRFTENDKEVVEGLRAMLKLPAIHVDGRPRFERVLEGL